MTKTIRLFLSRQIRFSDFYCTILIKSGGVLKSKKDGVRKLLCGETITWHSNCPIIIRGLSSEHCKVVWTLYKSDILPFNLERHKTVG